MGREKSDRNRDGSSISSNEYAGLLLAVLVPFVGLGFGIYLRHEGSVFGNRIIGLSLAAAAIWIFLVIQ
ncbi:MAG: hypothetical protein WEB05_06050 [Solirubrobacterales bacterium]